ncbi:chitinase [Streptomyces antioxidans]|uniref:chitinase n=1 Tax=Streptomyces antioxidans TaxID=1507734 RepID=A0A1V4D8X7_9ACTN|nr:glycoside hydrolase family 18 protein [Streptomyces antioxidans]OPF81627.1 chitinase [Streptomyces antioxidans]
MLRPGRLSAALAAICTAALTATLLAGSAAAGEPRSADIPQATSKAAKTPTTKTTTTKAATTEAAGDKVVGYFTEWGIYQRNYHVKNVETSGSAAKLTHINYAFGNVTGGKCAIGDSYADYDKAYDAASSVDGQADTWDAGALRGNFNQLRKLKKLHPGLKVLWSFGGWTWSSGFTEAAKNPAAFAQSCYDLVEDPRWADVFDGIDIDWEYPNACGLTCDTSGKDAFKNLMSAVRAKFGSSNLVTAAITADASSGGKIEAADYAGAASYVDWYNPMTYDFFGAWAAQGPTAPHSPLTSYNGIPQEGFNTDAAISELKGLGIPASKLLLGIGFYGRGWTGVSQDAPGGTATGAAPGTYEAGIEDYKVLKGSCPATGTVAGTAYAHCGSQWWSYDTPATIAGKMNYKQQQGLGGTFFWELSGDTANGELIKSIS